MLFRKINFLRKTFMFHQISFYFLSLLLTLFFFSANSTLAQYCIGSTTYVVHDEAGNVMTEENLKKLTVKNVNGLTLKLKKAANNTATDSYEAEFIRGIYQDNILKEVRREMRNIVVMTNPLFFDILCGKIGDLTLEYKGKQMRLIFDIGEHNTSYQIDSPPFQEGTFHLQSRRCKDGAKPPVIDNRNTGKCVVTADNWEGMDKDWVRHLIWNDFWGGQLDSTLTCRDKKIDIINNQKDWSDSWKLFREAAKGNPLPLIDFRTEVVLIKYLSGQPPSLSYDSIVVDKKGDLTFRGVARPGLIHHRACSVLLIRIYRSGVKTIEGKLLLGNTEEQFLKLPL
jgi:hypothetical protein